MEAPESQPPVSLPDELVSEIPLWEEGNRPIWANVPLFQELK